jgi:hypothetical protein
MLFVELINRFVEQRKAMHEKMPCGSTDPPGDSPVSPPIGLG